MNHHSKGLFRLLWGKQSMKVGMGRPIGKLLQYGGLGLDGSNENGEKRVELIGLLMRGAT